MQPFFHNGLSITARDTNYRNLEIFPMSFGKFLQSLQRIRHDQEIGEIENGKWRVGSGLRTILLHSILHFPFSILHSLKVFFRNHEVAHSPII